MAVAYWRLARVLRFELRETRRAVTVGGYRFPDRESQPEMYDFIFEQMRQDPRALPAKLDPMLQELQACRVEVDAKGYLEKFGMERLRRIPGRYYDTFMTWNSGGELVVKKAKLWGNGTKPAKYFQDENNLIEVIKEAKQLPLLKLDEMIARTPELERYLDGGTE